MRIFATDDNNVQGGDNFVEYFVEHNLAHSLLDDESKLYEENYNMQMTRKNYGSLTRKLNILIRYDEAFSTSKCSNIMTVHEATVKKFLSESTHLLSKNEKLVKDHVVKMEATLNKMNELQKFILNDNTMHNFLLSTSIKTLVEH